MGEIWVSSDFHLFHNQPFLYESRGFSSVYEMNEAIITNWNSMVAYNDEVYVCGDMMLNDVEGGIRLLKQFNGNFHIVIGNHDTDTKVAAYYDCYNVKSVEYAYRLHVGNWRFYLSHFPTLVGEYDTSKAPTRQLYNLCGHTHTTDMWLDWNKGRIIHCEMDTNNCKPWNMEEIINNLRSKTNG